MKKIIYNNINFDSKEELNLYYYFEELQNNGYINDFEYQPESFNLSNKVEYVYIHENKKIITSATLLQSHKYTCDFKIIWNIKSKNIFYLNINDKIKLNKIPFIAQNNVSWCECKPSFDYKNMTRLSVLNKKWVMNKYNIYVQTIIPTGKDNCLFSKTFVPKKCLYTNKKHKFKKFKYKIKSLQEYIDMLGDDNE